MKAHQHKMSARLVSVVAGLGGLSALLVTQKEKFQAYASSSKHKGRSKGDASGWGEDRDGSKWDSNWDKMAPKPKESSEGGESEVPSTSKASRHLILIRHGQYEHWHKDSEKKVLTELGRKQAIATGKSTHIYRWILLL